MLFPTIAAVLLTTSTVPIWTVSAASFKDGNSSCNVKAWVRAEDLSPNAIVNGSSSPPCLTQILIPTKKPVPLGDLRVKVDQVCTDEVASVSLELRLDEFSEVRYLWVAISTNI
jgi:hypothetical protein